MSSCSSTRKARGFPGVDERARRGARRRCGHRCARRRSDPSRESHGELPSSRPAVAGLAGADERRPGQRAAEREPAAAYATRQRLGPFLPDVVAVAEHRGAQDCRGVASRRTRSRDSPRRAPRARRRSARDRREGSCHRGRRRRACRTSRSGSRRPHHSRAPSERAARRRAAGAVSTASIGASSTPYRRASSDPTCARARSESFAVAGLMRPAARARRVGQRDDGHAVALEALADRRREIGETEHASKREAAHRDDQPGSKQLELPVAPELAEVLLARRRCAVAATRRHAPGIAACHRRAVERRVERLLLELEPAAELLAGAAAPREPLLALDDPGRLSEEIRVLAGERAPHRQRLEREAGLDAGTAA